MTFAQHVFHARETVQSRRLLADLTALFRKWRSRARGRRDLAALSDRSLRDIGLSRSDALREIRKPFWRA
jgi:uncharacterized protein YjiS (DUF1127 family)